MSADEQRQKAIDLMAADIARRWFPAGNDDRDLLRTLVEPIVDHHAECSARLHREAS